MIAQGQRQWRTFRWPRLLPLFERYDISGLALGTLFVLLTEACATVVALIDCVLLSRALRLRCESFDLAAEFSEQAHYGSEEGRQRDKGSAA